MIVGGNFRQETACVFVRYWRAGYGGVRTNDGTDTMAIKKLTPAERKLDQAMLLALEYAQQYPAHWHEISPYSVDHAAVEKLKERGIVEVEGKRYRLKGRSP